MLFSDQLAIEPTGQGQYVSKELPGKMGNTMPIAYGGCTLGVAMHAACLSVPATHKLYSAMGYYLGPASTEKHLHCTVESIRNTRSFATRRVQVTQTQPNGQHRACLEVLVDFHAEEPAWLDYSATPSRKYSPPDQCRTLAQRAAALVESGNLSPEAANEFMTQLGMMQEYFDNRSCPEGITAQNLSGSAKSVVTTQDALPMAEKTSADWHRTKLPLGSIPEQMAGLGFLLDGGLAFLPLSHMNMALDEAGACSSLDFALRVFTPKLDLHDWHLKERISSAAGAGRTYSEARLWNEEGKLMASMTQQSIMRPKKAPSPVL